MSFDVARYLDLYVSESREHLAASQEIASRPGPVDEPGLLELYRHAHSLKGMAATMGYTEVVELTHAVEDLLEGARAGTVGSLPTADLLPALDCLSRMVERAARRQPAEDPEAAAHVRRLRARPERPPLPRAASTVRPPPRIPRPAETSPRVWHVDLWIPGEDLPRAERMGELFRVLTAMGELRGTSPLAPSRDGSRWRLSLLLATGAPREALAASLARLPGIASFVVRPDPVPAAPAGGPARAGGWAKVRTETLDALVEAASDLLLDEVRGAPGGDPAEALRRAARRRRLVRRIHAEALELRLEPFASVAHRLQLAARGAGNELGKRVRLDLEGGDVRLDRAVLDALVDPLLHLVRNAVDHGIEEPAARARAGKPAEGRVVLRLEGDGADVRIAVEDDGGGMDLAGLRSTAVRRGFAAPTEVQAMSDAQTLLLATRPGLSTAAGAGPVSGRGIGMDVALHALERLGGTFALHSEAGRGTRVVLRLPRSVAARAVLLVRAGGSPYALPLEFVARAGRGEGATAAVDLTVRLGLPPAPCGGDVVWIRAGGSEVAVRVDELVGRSELVVSPLQGPLARLPLFSGAALLPDGSIALLLEPAQLAHPPRGTEPPPGDVAS